MVVYSCITMLKLQNTHNATLFFPNGSTVSNVAYADSYAPILFKGAKHKNMSCTYKYIHLKQYYREYLLSVFKALHKSLRELNDQIRLISESYSQ